VYKPWPRPITTFSSFYQQLNPYNPPGLQYVQQHWIVLINELLPAGFDERERAFTDNPVGQKLKFQAFEHDDGDQDISSEDRALSAANQDHLRKWYKGWTKVGKEQEYFEANTESFEAGKDQYSAERERLNAERKRSFGIEASSSDENRRFIELTISDSSPGADPPTDNGPQTQTVATAGEYPRNGQGHNHFRRLHRGKRPGKQKRDSYLRKLSTTVNSDAFGVDATAEDQESQTARTARVLTNSTHQGGAVSTGKLSLESLTSLGNTKRSQDDIVHFSFTPSPERVDPCSLSQSELETAIAELLSTVKCEMNTIHPDRAKMMHIY
jgi:hypothetical protein